MKKIEAIFIDIDGCLIPVDGEMPRPDFFINSLGLISSWIRVADGGKGNSKVSDWLNAGSTKNFPKIGFCTGRDRNYVEAIAYCLSRPDSWSVIQSGAYLFNPTTKELLLNPAITPEVKNAFENISRQGIPQILKKCGQLFLYPQDPICIAFEKKFGTTISIEEAFKITKEILADIIPLDIINITHSDIAIDISPAGINKASGLKFWSQTTGIDLFNVLAIGDSKGDIPMLDIAGYVGCPNNASDECKKLVQQKNGKVADHDFAKGVTEVIMYFRLKG